MKRRVVIWAFAGFLVAGLWALYAASTFPSPLISPHPLVWTLINITSPIVLAGFHFDFAVKLHWFLLANAATYGLLGLAVESLRQRLMHVE